MGNDVPYWAAYTLEILLGKATVPVPD